MGYQDPQEVKELRWGTLKELSESEDKTIAKQAKRLIKIIKKNPPKLLDDEMKLLKDAGINMEKYAAVIRYMKGSRRVSVAWLAQTKSNKDALVWSIIAPPADKRKSVKVAEWLDLRNLMDDIIKWGNK